jgi:heme exporter protein CcmD
MALPLASCTEVTGKYAVFIWGSYGFTLVVLLWNALAPGLRRAQLRRRLAEDDGDVNG